MKPLTWSRMQSGVWNGKVGQFTFFAVAWHTGEHAYYVFPKLPGIKSVKVQSEADGKFIADQLYKHWLEMLR